MRILSISANNFNRTRQNFNGTFKATEGARKFLQKIAPADEIINSLDVACHQNPVDFLIKLEEMSRIELGKQINGFHLSSFKNGKIVDKGVFIPARNGQDVMCLVVTSGEMFQKLI